MDLVDVLGRLAAKDAGGYHPGSPRATEPTALAAMALLAHGREAEARPLLDWLANFQSGDGGLGIWNEQPTPGWPTGWAILAWTAAEHSAIADASDARARQRAIDYILSVKGSGIEWIEHSGHDTTIIGWPWVDGTHSWLEPTAMNVLALKHAGLGHHPRTREGERLLQDRLLATGGCNYGNTVVFRQQLKPQLEPTGLCLVALAGEPDASGRVAKSIDYLQRELTASTATISLCYGLLGLAAQGHPPAMADAWLTAACRRTLTRDPSTYKLALVALASLGTACPLIHMSVPLEQAT